MFWKFPLKEVVSCFRKGLYSVIWSVNNQAELSAAYDYFSSLSEIPGSAQEPRQMSV